MRILTRSFRQNSSVWDEHEDDRIRIGRRPASDDGAAKAHRPYFEVLIVTGAPAERWPAIATEWRRLRRSQDAFIYEPVIVGSVEDALCATMLNTDLAAVDYSRRLCLPLAPRCAGAA